MIDPTSPLSSVAPGPFAEPLLPELAPMPLGDQRQISVTSKPAAGSPDPSTATIHDRRH